MSGAKEVLKSGWHPRGKDGGRESWRGDNKGINQVSGWIGKKKNPTEAARDHQSAPLATLKDPSAFGPPPKNVNYYGAGAVPNSTTPDKSGLGAPLSKAELQVQQQREQELANEEEEDQSPAPRLPFRSNTTGISTNSLPKPPARRLNGNQEESSRTTDSTPPPKPSLPPRLPPRRDSSSTIEGAAPDSSPPLPSRTSSSFGQLNKGAISRLGQSGVSVPGFNIGQKPQAAIRPPPSNTTNFQEPADSGANRPSLNKLSSRFSNTTIQSQGSSASQGTTWAQKQAAIRTAQNFQKDPSSVSLADARSAVSTVNNFRERHGEQVARGAQAANKLNQQYSLTDKLAASGVVASSPQQEEEQLNPSAAAVPPVKKRPPPPPPKKKIDLQSSPELSPVPPPIPLASKPGT